MKPIGVDLLPLSVLVSRTKLARPSVSALVKAAEAAEAAASAASAASAAKPTRAESELLRRALAPSACGSLRASLMSAGSEPAGRCVRVATASAVRSLAKLVADGGWLRSREPAVAPSGAGKVLAQRLAEIQEDIEGLAGRRPGPVFEADARALPLPDRCVQAVITSPPYPNRHDYTRVFGVELDLLFGLGTGVKKLRYRAMRSHPEAQAPDKVRDGYEESSALERAVDKVAAEHADPRIAKMLRGYFEDAYGVLAELRRVLAPGGRAALVVGNASYCGQPIMVDLHLAELAELAGLRVDGIDLLRHRGNSAQQMAAHGRRPSRESAVVLTRL